MDAIALDLPSASLDVVVSLFLLRHLEDPEKGIREMARVLRPGGRLVIGIGGGPWFPTIAWARRATDVLIRSLSVRRGRLLSAPGFLRQLMNARGLTASPALPERRRGRKDFSERQNSG